MLHTMLIGDREIHLKFTAKNLIAMENTAAEALGEGKRYMSMEELMSGIDRMNVLMYLFRKALDWKGSGAKPTEAEDLFDTYMEMEELDTGERYKNFQFEIACALAASRGIDLKKSMELAAQMQKQAAEIQANGTGE